MSSHYAYKSHNHLEYMYIPGPAKLIAHNVQKVMIQFNCYNPALLWSVKVIAAAVWM